MIQLPPQKWGEIYDLLVELGGASNAEHWKRSFIHAQREGCYEWRFSGLLGFGGKFWNNCGRLYVSCYREDDNPEREEIIEKINAKLKEYYKERHG